MPSSFDKDYEPKSMPFNFAKYRLNSSFLGNYWTNLLTLAFMLCCWIILRLLMKTKIYKNNPKALKNKTLTFLYGAVLNFMVVELYGGLDDITLFFIFELKTTKLNTPFSWASFSFALLFTFLGIGIISFHFWILYKYQKLKRTQNQNEKDLHLDAFNQKYENIKVLFQDFKDISILTHSFLALLTLRSISLNLVLILVPPLYSLFQATLLLSINVLFAVFLLLKRPFKYLPNEITQYYSEIIILVTYISVFVLAILDEVSAEAIHARKILNQCILKATLALNIGGFVFQSIGILASIYAIYLAWKNYRKQKKSVANLTDETNTTKTLNNTSRAADRQSTILENYLVHESNLNTKPSMENLFLQTNHNSHFDSQTQFPLRKPERTVNELNNYLKPKRRFLNPPLVPSTLEQSSSATKFPNDIDTTLAENSQIIQNQSLKKQNTQNVSHQIIVNRKKRILNYS